MLEIPAAIFDSMIEHARSEMPIECCGLLAGRAGTVERRFPLRNTLASPVAYLADVEELFTAFREMHRCSDELIAIYHSHPTSEARPSRVDLAENFYGEIPRVIISLAGPEPSVRAFRLYADHFDELPCLRKPN